VEVIEIYASGDEHVSKQAGTQIVTTKLVLQCSGEPAEDREYTERNVLDVCSRIPVNQVEFTKNGKSISSVKGHDNVDLTITLDAPAPPSSPWVKLEVTPAGNLTRCHRTFKSPKARHKRR
jgi:hypothetical protein